MNIIQHHSINLLAAIFVLASQLGGCSSTSYKPSSVSAGEISIGQSTPAENINAESTLEQAIKFYESKSYDEAEFAFSAVSNQWESPNQQLEIRALTAACLSFLRQGEIELFLDQSRHLHTIAQHRNRLPKTTQLILLLAANWGGPSTQNLTIDRRITQWLDTKRNGGSH